MKTYIVTCRGVFPETVIAKLKALGVYWTQVRSQNNLPSRRVRLEMLADAMNEDQAIQKARFAVDASGGSGTDYTCLCEVSKAASEALDLANTTDRLPHAAAQRVWGEI